MTIHLIKKNYKQQSILLKKYNVIFIALILAILTISLNAMDSYSEIYPLHDAVQNAHERKVMEYISDNNDNISKPDNKGRTPLHYAVRKGNFVLVAHLIGSGAHVNAKKIRHQSDNLFVNLFFYAYDFFYVVFTGISAHTDTNSTPLHEIARKTTSFQQEKESHLKIAHCLLAAGANPNVALIPRYGGQGFSPLHYACFNNNDELVELLLKHGAHPDGTLNLNCYSELTPLKSASLLKYKKIVAMLLLAGAKIQDRTLIKKCFSKKTLLRHLITSNAEDFLQTLKALIEDTEMSNGILKHDPALEFLIKPHQHWRDLLVTLLTYTAAQGEVDNARCIVSLFPSTAKLTPIELEKLLHRSFISRQKNMVFFLLYTGARPSLIEQKTYDLLKTNQQLLPWQELLLKQWNLRHYIAQLRHDNETYMSFLPLDLFENVLAFFINSAH